MKKLLTISLVVFLGGFVLGGCWIENDIKNGDAFRAAFPDEDTLTIKTQALEQNQQGLTSMGQALVGDRADLHDLSFAVAFSVNFHARNIMEVLWFITRFPPSQAIEEDGVIGDPGEEFPYDARAVWGPFQDDEGKNLEFILHVWRGTDPEDNRRTFIFFVAGRPRVAPTRTGSRTWWAAPSPSRAMRTASAWSSWTSTPSGPWIRPRTTWAW